MSAFKRELTDLRHQYSLLEISDCAPEETEKYEQIFKKDKAALPPEIIAIESYVDGNPKYKFHHCTNRTDITFEDRIEYLQLKQTEHLNSIRKMMLFFVVLTCISLAAGVLIALNLFS